MKLRKTIYAAISATVMIAMLCVSAMAASVTNKTISLPANQVWTSATGNSVARSGSYNDVGARCNSVYPDSGADFFGKIQCRVLNSYGTKIMDDDYVVLDEGADGYTYIPIKNGYLSVTTVYFQFRGNTSAAANAVVSYTGR